jgi:hypothetical protein
MAKLDRANAAESLSTFGARSRFGSKRQILGRTGHSHFGTVEN